MENKLTVFNKDVIPVYTTENGERVVLGREMHELECKLIALLGEGQLKNIGEQIAEIVRQHDLQKSPDVCRMLFTYIISVIDDWNSV